MARPRRRQPAAQRPTLPESATKPGAALSVWTPAVIVMALLLALVTLRHAWVADDAYITLRTSDNWLRGYGPTWNIAERVQAYSHPLWFLLLTPLYALLRDPWLTALLASLAASLAALIVVARLAAPRGLGWLALALLALSIAYVDYSTSGLENPLSYLLLALFLWRYARLGPRDSAYLSVALLGGLAVLTRYDLALFVGPALVYALATGKARHPWRDSLIGAAPVLAWLLFSTVYYGAPLPNTTYAKLGTDIPRGEVLQQGLAYYVDALVRDPLTLALIALALLLPLHRPARRAWPLALGLLLYLGYVVWIGGCFMSLRFFSTAALWAVCLLALYGGELLSGRQGQIAAAALLLLGLMGQPITLLSGQDYTYAGATWDEIVGPQRVTDEHRVYYPDTGLLQWQRTGRSPGRDWWLAQQPRVFARPEQVLGEAAIGRVGFYAGPQRHIMDKLGLADPLLARLPAIRNSDWRPGHFYRVEPPGYMDSLAQDANLLADPGLAAYYEQIRLITRGPLWTRARLAAIVRLNLGLYDHLIDRERYRLPELVRIDLGALRDQAPVRLADSGLDIVLGEVRHDVALQVQLDCDDEYRIEFRREGVTVGHAIAPASFADAASSLVTMAVPVPRAAARRGYDTVRILPVWGDGDYAAGALTFAARHQAYLPSSLASRTNSLNSASVTLSGTEWSEAMT